MGLISYGKITRAHGLSGGVRLTPFSRHFESLETLDSIFIEKVREKAPERFMLSEFRLEKGSALLKLEGVDTIDKAEELVGCDVYIEKSRLPELEEGEFYWFELIGLETFTDDGKYLGQVENLIDRALQSVLVVKKDGKEILIPLSEPIIKEINLKESKIVISPVDGLLNKA
ncbi:MAG: ribosome maturation factor RimM [Thermodesulfobacteriota bacterium]